MRAIRTATADDITIASMLWGRPVNATQYGRQFWKPTTPSITTDVVDFFGSIYVPDNSSTQLADSGFLASVVAAVGPSSTSSFQAKLATADRRKGITSWSNTNIQNLTVEQLDVVLPQVGISWHSNYLSSTGVTAPGIDYIPHIFGQAQLTSQNLADCVTYSTTGEMLGFNEPDIGNASNGTPIMSPTLAASLWPQLQSTGLDVIGPSIANNGSGYTNSNSWMDQFFAALDLAGTPRPTKLQVHVYIASFANPFTAAVSVQTTLDAIHAKYGLPILLTEFGLINFSGGPPPLFWQFPTGGQNALFLECALPRLDSLSYVDRYSFYTGGPWPKVEQGGIRTGGNCLFDANGDLTASGVAYAQSA